MSLPTPLSLGPYLQELAHQHDRCLLYLGPNWSGTALLYLAMVRDIAAGMEPEVTVVTRLLDRSALAALPPGLRGDLPLIYCLRDGELREVITGNLPWHVVRARIYRFQRD